MDSWDLTAANIEPRKPEVLISEIGVARAIAICLPAGEMLQEHEVHEHAYLMLVSGELELAGVDGGTGSVTPGTVIHWEPKERHEVRATQDSKFLLLLAPWPGEGHPGPGGRDNPTPSRVHPALDAGLARSRLVS